MSQFYFKRRKSRIISLGNGIEAFPLPIKCVVVGDCTVGKTSLITSYTTGLFPDQYVPTVRETYHKEIISDGVVIDLELCEITGEEGLERFRSVSYLETDIFIVCFSIVSPKSFHNVINKWIPEIKRYLPNKPFILVGTKSDLRENREIVKELSRTNESPIEKQLGQELASKYGAIDYVESSIMTTVGVSQIFDESIKKVLQFYMGPVEHRKCSIS